MTDLISREALIKETQNCFVDGKIPHWLYDLITTAPAVSCEVVAYLYRCQHKQQNPKYTEWACVSNNAHWPVDQWQSYDVLPLYTTPQQPQEQGELVKKAVADALEEVLKILDGHIDRATTLGQQEEFREAQARIRALIKRNAEEGE